MDFEPEEVARQLSISTSLAPFTVNGVKVNLLDTPGYADFAGEMVTALANVDLAVVVVSATDGVQAQTEDAWRAAARLGVPRVIVINKLDRERADFDRTLAEIRESFGAGVAPVELPIGHEADFHGVIDLLDDTATHYDMPAAGGAVDGTVPPAGHEGPIPDDLVDEEHTVHEQLVEGIVVGDDDLMERYLNGETHRLRRAREEPGRRGRLGQRVPGAVLLGRERRRRGPAGPPDRGAVPEPGVAAAGRWPRRGPRPPRSRATRAGRPLLTVTKTFNDGHTGKMSLCKVVSGTLQPDAVLVNPRTREEERLHALQSIAGHATAPATSVAAGDFVAVPRLNGTRTGDTLAPKGQPVVVPPPDAAGAGAPGGGEAGHAGRRRQADVGAPAAVRRGPVADGDPRRRDAPDHPRRERRGAPGRHPRAARPQVQRPRRARGAAHPLPRDDHQAGGRRRASTRSSRAATGSSASATSASSRCGRGEGFAVPRRGRRRGDPPPVHPGGREGRARDVRRRAASTATPWSTSP